VPLEELALLPDAVLAALVPPPLLDVTGVVGVAGVVDVAGVLDVTGVVDVTGFADEAEAEVAALSNEPPPQALKVRYAAAAAARSSG